MNLYVTKNGQQMGPYTLPEAEQLVAAGTLLPNDWAWYEGITDWVPLEQVPGFGSPAGSGAVPVIAASEDAAFASATPLPPVRRPVLVWVICLFFFILIPLGIISVVATPFLLSFSSRMQEQTSATLQTQLDNTTDPAEKDRLIALRNQLRDSAAQTSQITNHGIGYYAYAIFSMLVVLAAAILLFCLRRSALYAFIAAFVISLLGGIYNYMTTALPHVHGATEAAAQSIGIIIGLACAVIYWGIMLGSIFYAWHLSRRGVLR